MQIRKATVADHSEIRQLFYDTINSVNAKDYTPGQVMVWSAAYTDTEKWMGKIASQHFFVAEQNNKIIGFASIEHHGYLDYMYVHKDFQEQGIATALLNELEKIAADLKLKEVWAHVSLTARPFFKSKGFELTKVYTTQVGDVEFEDSIMTKAYSISNAGYLDYTT